MSPTMMRCCFVFTTWLTDSFDYGQYRRPSLSNYAMLSLLTLMPNRNRSTEITARQHRLLLATSLLQPVSFPLVLVQFARKQVEHVILKRKASCKLPVAIVFLFFFLTAQNRF